MKFQRELSRGDVINAKCAHGIGCAPRQDLASIAENCDLCIGNGCAGRVQENSANGMGRRAIFDGSGTISSLGSARDWQHQSY